MSMKLKAIVKQMTVARERMRKEGQAAMNEAFVEFFQAHPEAKAIMWSQYTPYFNDGDTCTFSVNEWELKVDPTKLAEDLQAKFHEDDEEEDYCYGDGCAIYTLETFGGLNEYNLKKKVRDLTGAESSLVKDYNELKDSCCDEDDLLLEVFGDHVTVTVTREGINTDECEHD